MSLSRRAVAMAVGEAGSIDFNAVQIPLDQGEYTMRPVREITAGREHIGTIVLRAFRIAGYEEDCDGSFMARLENIDKDGKLTGWTPSHRGLHPFKDLVITAEEWKSMFWS